MTVTNFNATTPQSKTVKSLLEAYLSLDISNTERFFTEDFKFQTFPTIPDLPDEPKGAHFERWGPIFTMMSKIKSDVHEVIEAPGKVVINHTITLYTLDGVELDYDSLEIFTLVEKNGEFKVADIRDYSDPEKRGKLHAWAAKALEKRAT